MPRALTSSVLALGTSALVLMLPACEPRDAGVATAGAATTTAGATAAANSGSIPVTSRSAEAHRLYLEGRALSENLRAHDGRQLYARAAEADPSFAMAHFQLAANAATAKDFFTHMKRAVALADSASEGERLMILALEAGGNADPSKALEYQRQLVELYPNDERAHFLSGNGWFGQQEFRKAVDAYQAATRINPRFAPAYNLLGYAQRSLEDYEASEAAFRKYIELIPNDPNPYDSYAELLMKTGRFEESVAQYRKALALDPKFSASRVGIATNRMLQGRHDEALKEMDGMLRDARDDGERRTALFTRGVILTDAGRTDEAVREIEREYALDARLADTANMSGDAQLLGNILLDAGRADAAAARFRQALQLVERSSLSDDVKQDIRLADRYNRGRVALAKGDLATAKAEANAYTDGAAARKNLFRTRQAHALVGAIELKEGQYDQAIAHLSQASQQDPQVLYWTALAYQGKGDSAKAKAFAGRAAKANVLPLMSYAFVREKAKKMA